MIYHKKKISLLLITILFLPNISLAFDKTENYSDFTAWYENKFTEEIPFKAAAVLDYETLEPLYYHQEKKVMPSASLIKLITAGTLVRFPINWQRKISFSWWDNEGDLRPFVGPNDRFSLLPIEEDDPITILEALAAMLIKSANNCANGLAGVAGITRKQFVEAMQFTTFNWQMQNTIVHEPSGLSLKNLTTARDMAYASCYAFKDEKISEWASQPEFTIFTDSGEEIKMKHTVHDVRDNPQNYFGAKTGFLYETRFHLVAGFITPQGKKICVAIMSTYNRQESEDILNDIGQWVDEMYKFD
ncbi:serine hydrolase [bacterium]|nr:serine hydrolase [bacterium]